jgi:tripartite-type tricarboxylate transporter receptor subunit TctC
MLLAAAVRVSPLAALSQAAAYPDRANRFVVPYPPSGGTDVIVRIVQGKFQQLLGQQIVMENKAGGGSVGT